MRLARQWVNALKRNCRCDVGMRAATRATKSPCGSIKAKPLPTLQILERHCLDQRRFSGSRLADDVDVRKTVFVFDAEHPIIIAKIHAVIT